MNLYSQISESKLQAIVEHTYDAAFVDPMIGFLFVGHDKERIIDMQLKFLRARFGGPKEYLSSGGKDLKSAHKNLGLRRGHFHRRVILLKEAMEAEQLPKDIQDLWLDWEKQFEQLILGTEADCQS